MLLALLSRQGPRNCWTLAEQAGEDRPWGMQYLLSRAAWDTDAVAGELRRFVVEHLGAADGILVVYETGDLKKGTHTVGVQRGVHRHRRADRERPGRRLSRLRQPAWARDDRPGAVSAQVVDRRPGPVRGRRRPGRGRLRDQAGAGPGADRTRPGRRGAGRVG